MDAFDQHIWVSLQMHSILSHWELQVICCQKSTPSFLRNDSMNDPAIMPSCISKYTNRHSIKGVCSHAAATTFTPAVPTPSSSTLVIIYSIVFLGSTKLDSSIPSYILVEVWNFEPPKHHVQLWLWRDNCNIIPMSFCAKDMLDYLWDLIQYQSMVKVESISRSCHWMDNSVFQTSLYGSLTMHICGRQDMGAAKHPA
jgi:hypothetical protein